MASIFEDKIVTDRRGVEWREAPGYQQQDAAAPGWLALASSSGETLTFDQVLMFYGINGPAGPFLTVTLDPS